MAAAQRWPIRLDHCFMRVCLHEAMGCPWTQVLHRPAIRSMPEADELTARERDVLAAVLDGETNKAVGQRLGISHHTVEIHRSRAMAKLNATSPTELMRHVLIMEGG